MGAAWPRRCGPLRLGSPGVGSRLRGLDGCYGGGRRGACARDAGMTCRGLAPARSAPSVARGVWRDKERKGGKDGTEAGRGRFDGAAAGATARRRVVPVGMVRV